MALWDKLINKGDKGKKEAQELWDRAIKYFDGKLYNRALKDLGDALVLNPEFKSQAVDLMHSLSGSDNEEMAISVGFALLKMDPKDSELMNKLGNSLRKTHSFAKAQKLYQYALKINPKFTFAKYNLAATSFRITTADSELVTQTKKAESLSVFRKYEFQGNRVEFHPLHNEVMNHTGEVEQFEPEEDEGEGGEGEESREMSEEEQAIINDGKIQTLKSDITDSNGSWESHFNMGLFYDLLDMGELAVQNYKAAMEKEPGQIIPINNLAVALSSHMEKHQEAETLLLKALEKNRYERTLLLNLAMVYKKMAKGFQMLKFFVYAGDLLAKSMYQFDTHDAQEHAKDLFERRKYLEAIPVFEHFSLEKPDDYWFEKLVVMYHNQKKDEMEINTLKRHARFNPEHPGAGPKLIEIADGLEKEAREKMEKGNRFPAISLLEQANKIKETPERLLDLVQLYQEEGEEILSDNALRKFKKLTGETEGPSEKAEKE